MSNTIQPDPGGTDPTPRGRLSAFLQSLSSTSRRQRRRTRLDAETADRVSELESSEKVLVAEAAELAARAKRDKIAGNANVERAREKAAEVRARRESRQPLDGIRQNLLLMILDSPAKMISFILGFYCVFVIPASGLAYLMRTGHVEISIALGGAGAVGGLVVGGLGVLGLVSARRGAKNAIEPAPTPSSVEHRQGDEPAGPPERESPDSPAA